MDSDKNSSTGYGFLVPQYKQITSMSQSFVLHKIGQSCWEEDLNKGRSSILITNESFLELLSLCNSLCFKYFQIPKYIYWPLHVSSKFTFLDVLGNTLESLSKSIPKSHNNLSRLSNKVRLQLFSTAHPERSSLSLVNLEKQLTFIIIYRAFYHRFQIINFSYTTQNCESKLP